MEAMHTYHFKYKYDTKSSRGYTNLITIQATDRYLAFVLAEQKMYELVNAENRLNPRDLKIRN